MKGFSMIHVAVGVIHRQNKILISQRLPHQHLSGYWEFPGGKVEPNEPVDDALKRELFEELNIQITEAEPLFCLSHHYPDKHVGLDVWLVESFTGKAIGNEGQQIRWVERSQLKEYQFPQANEFILEFLNQKIN